jgi:hypothetical protein
MLRQLSDMRQLPASAGVYGLHWQTSQATNLQNVGECTESYYGLGHATDTRR